MRSARLSSLVFVSMLAVSLSTTIACSSSESGEEVGTSQDAIRALQPGEVLGKIVSGETKTIDYTSTPRFRAVSFFANRGDEVDIWARSTTGDAMLWLAASDYTNVALNDDADATTSDAHIKTKLAKAGQYFIVLRDHFERAAQFSLSLTKRAECDPDEQECPVPLPPATPLVIPAATSEVGTALYAMSASRTAPRLGGYVTPVACPFPETRMGSTVTPYTYVRVENHESTDRRVSLWTSTPSSVALNAPDVLRDTVMTVYAGTVEPQTLSERLACVPGTASVDTCESLVATACLDDHAGFLVDDTIGGNQSIVVPANGTITVYVGSFFARTTDGVFQLNVRAEP